MPDTVVGTGEMTVNERWQEYEFLTNALYDFSHQTGLRNSASNSRNKKT